MPIQRASFKSVRKDKKKHLRNLRINSELKTLAKKFTVAADGKKSEEAKEAFQALISHIGKAASKGILHKNTASRKVSRLAKRLKKVDQKA
ncbi:MAG: 30S ribosomal protein S20 [Candidatus Omnitrophota bacterium]